MHRSAPCGCAYRRLILSLLIVLGILSVLLALAQDQHTLKVESAYAAGDPRFPPNVAALVNAATRRIGFETYLYDTGQYSRYGASRGDPSGAPMSRPALAFDEPVVARHSFQALSIRLR